MNNTKKIIKVESDTKPIKHRTDINDFVPRDELEEYLVIAEAKEQEVMSPPFNFTLTRKFYALSSLLIFGFSISLIGGVLPVIITGKISSVFASSPWQMPFFISSMLSIIICPIAIFLLGNVSGRITVNTDKVKIVNIFGIHKTIECHNVMIVNNRLNYRIYDISIINKLSRASLYIYKTFGGINIPYEFINETNSIDKSIELLKTNPCYRHNNTNYI